MLQCLAIYLQLFQHLTLKNIQKPIRQSICLRITPAVVGALVYAVIVIATITILDIPTTMIAVATILALLYIRKF